MSAVVVLSGNRRGEVGLLVGPDKTNKWSRNTRRLVRFPGETFPKDFQSFHVSNLRSATDEESAL